MTTVAYPALRRYFYGAGRGSRGGRYTTSHKRGGGADIRRALRRAPLLWWSLLIAAVRQARLGLLGAAWRVLAESCQALLHAFRGAPWAGQTVWGQP